MISAITNRGQLVFRVFHGTFRAPMFVDFMRRLRQQAGGKVYLIVDGHGNVPRLVETWLVPQGCCSGGSER
jgi:hypothetical protein